MPTRLPQIAAFVLLCHFGVACAATYVSDNLSINLRRGPGTGFRISEMLPAGQQLQVLDRSEGWSKVKTNDGKTGYVLSRFLTDQPSAHERLAAAQKKLRKLEDTKKSQKAELAQAMHGSSQLGKLKKTLVAENKSLRQQLANIKAASANAVRLSNQNRKFRQQILSLQSETERLRHDNKALQSRRDGMRTGALILVGGIIVGLVLPMFRRRSGTRRNLL